MEDNRGQGDDLVVVFRAQSEYIADMLVGMLTNEGVPAILESHMVPWMDGIMMSDAGHWGDIVVPEEYAQRSVELIDEFMSSETENGDDAQSEEV